MTVVNGMGPTNPPVRERVTSSPGELHELLLEWMERKVAKTATLEFSRFYASKMCPYDLRNGRSYLQASFFIMKTFL